MDFVGRTTELSLLESQYLLDHPFVIVSGRRRVGKSTLIMKFLEGKDHLYYEVDESSRQMLLPAFSRAVCKELGLPPTEFPDWESAFTMYVSLRPGRKVIVIDEFQYMLMADDGILHRLQSLWDNLLSKQDVMLILCGSYMSMMRGVSNDANSPLYQRNTADLVLRPLPFRDTVMGRPYREAVEAFSFTGGVPHYMTLMSPDRTPLESAESLTLLPGSPLTSEPTYLFSGEFRNIGSYNTYLRMMAEGASKLADIADRTHSESGSVTPYLQRLMNIDAVERDVPVTSDGTGKNGLYRISDHFLAFWFRFVHPFYNDILRGEFDEAVANLEEHFVDRHAALVFEDVCREELRDALRRAGVAARYGRYWDRDNEMDVAALDRRARTIYVGECKFVSRPVDARTVGRLIDRCGETRAFDDLTVRPCVFSVSGFTREAVDVASEEDAVLFQDGTPLRETPLEILATDRRGRRPGRRTGVRRPSAHPSDLASMFLMYTRMAGHPSGKENPRM